MPDVLHLHCCFHEHLITVHVPLLSRDLLGQWKRTINLWTEDHSVHDSVQLTFYKIRVVVSILASMYWQKQRTTWYAQEATLQIKSKMVPFLIYSWLLITVEPQGTKEISRVVKKPEPAELPWLPWRGRNVTPCFVPRTDQFSSMGSIAALSNHETMQWAQYDNIKI